MPAPTRTPIAPKAPLAIPHPIERAEAVTPGDVEHRNLHCALYGGCLQVVARKSWRDWSCEKCLVRLSVEPQGAAHWANARIRLD